MSAAFTTPRTTPRVMLPILFLTLLLTGCGASTPIHYHTLLDPVSEQTPARTAKFLIDLQPVDIPSQVDRPQLIVRSEDGSIQILEQERWVAPLASELRAALSADLERELGTVDIAQLPSSSPLPVLRIKIELRRFESAPERYAGLDATWSLAFENATRQALTCASQTQKLIGPGYANLVRGHREALAVLASRIAFAARQYAIGASESCRAD